ncbi:MAG: triose-phosphate isomerase, partial [Lachnospiraceae bacterium]|nr:triose-phosphate isomerase [Lachnospiraceae bacterium]
MRRKLAAANWKMNMTPIEAKALCEKLIPLVKSDDTDVLFCVPFIDIPVVRDSIKGTNIMLGAENFYHEDKGAYTGEISLDMLKCYDVTHVIIGHSERRQIF